MTLVPDTIVIRALILFHSVPRGSKASDTLTNDKGRTIAWFIEGLLINAFNSDMRMKASCIFDSKK